MTNTLSSAYQPAIPSPARPAWRWVFPIVWLVILILPSWVFFSERGGLSFLDGLESPDMSAAIFPLVGLYALLLVWTQVMLGSLMPLWQKIFPKIFVFHRAEGVFALLFATLHPLLLIGGIGLAPFMANDFVSPAQVKYVLLGKTVLMLVYLTVATALLMRQKILNRWWRKIHILNYAVFVGAWIHSWNLGSDIQSTNLQYLWIGFGLSVAIALILRMTKVGRYSGHAIES